MVWYSHLLKNFPQFIVIHTVKGFGIVNKACLLDAIYSQYKMSMCVRVCVCVSCLVVSDSATPWTIVLQAPHPWDSPG